MELFDTHAHYNDEKFDDDRDEIIKQIYTSGVTKFMCAGYSLESSKFGLEIAEKYDYVYTTSGISPNDIPETKKELDEQLIELENLAKSSKKVVGIGEIGLDYHWNKENKDLQKYAFLKQIEIANKLNFPIIIHTRDAIMDTIEIIKQNNFAKPGIFHCCVLNKDLINAGLKKGFYTSFSGTITFKNIKNTELIKDIPIENILIETDSPYLAPEPNRGKRNDSRNVYFVAKKIAEIKGLDIEKVAEITYKNAMKIFDIKNNE